MKFAMRAGFACTAMVVLVLASFVIVGCDDDEDEGTLEFGDVCLENGECISGQCRSTDLGGGVMRCTEECDDANPCTMGRCDEGLCLLGPPPIEPPVQIGYIYIGPVGDHGWTKAHDDGRAYLESQLGDQVEVNASPSIIPPDAPAEIESFIERGDDLIIGTSFDFLNSLQAAAGENPQVNFLTCSGFSVGPNMGSYFGRMYQVMYILGVMAGQMTTTNVIGVVGPVIIPETVRHLNAFALGVASVNADAEVVVSWVGNWFDLEGEPAAAEELVLEFGADIVFGHTDSTIPMERVVEGQDGDGVDDFPEGTPTIYTIGYDNPDSCVVNPAYTDYCLTSGYWNWGPIVTRIVEEMIAGTWLPSEIIWDPIENDRQSSMVHFAQPNADLVEASIISQMDDLAEQMADVTDDALYLPFAGPIHDRQGTLRIADGEYPTDEDLLSMCWYVHNVYDTEAELNDVPQQCSN